MFSNESLKKLILPLILEQFLAITIGACDQIMVSSIVIDGQKGIGVSAVSLIDQLAELFIQVFAAFATGGAVVCSQYLGHKDETKARSSARQLVYISLLLGFLIIGLCLPFKQQILSFLFGGAEKAVFTKSSEYFVWVFLSFPMLGIYSSCAALCRSMGNSKISLKVSLIMNIVNIVGNGIFIYGMKMDVNGAGLATLLSRIFAAIAMLIILHQKGKWQLYLEKIWLFKLDFKIIGRILKVAVPSGIENSVFHVGKTLVYSFMSGFGTVALAANGVANKICSFANIPGVAIGLASITIIGQCIGADEKEQAKYYGRKLLRASYLGMFLTAACVSALAPVIVLAFDVGPEAQDLSCKVIWSCMASSIFIWPMSFVLPNILKGAGDNKYTMLVSNISMWAFRVLASYLIAEWVIANFEDKSLALFAVWIGMYIDWVFRGLMFGIRFHRNRWLEKKVI